MYTNLNPNNTLNMSMNFARQRSDQQEGIAEVAATGSQSQNEQTAGEERKRKLANMLPPPTETSGNRINLRV